MLSKIIYITTLSSVIVLSNINTMEDSKKNKKPIALVETPGATPTDSGEGITPSKKRNGDSIDENIHKKSSITMLSKNTESSPLSFLTRKKQ